MKNNIVSRRNLPPGWIYALSSPESDTLKIGFTAGSPSDRCRQWSQKQGKGRPFNVVFEAYFHGAARVEKKIHTLLAAHWAGSEYFGITAAEFKVFMRYNFVPINFHRKTLRMLERFARIRSAKKDTLKRSIHFE